MDACQRIVDSRASEEAGSSESLPYKTETSTQVRSVESLMLLRLCPSYECPSASAPQPPSPSRPAPIPILRKPVVGCRRGSVDLSEASSCVPLSSSATQTSLFWCRLRSIIQIDIKYSEFNLITFSPIPVYTISRILSSRKFTESILL